MAVDKVMLRRAICDGAFGNVVNGAPQGQAPQFQVRVTPEVLTAVAGLSDDVINATLTLYVTSKQSALNQKIAKEQAQVIADQAALAELTPVAPGA